ncbi:hypothetical protein BpJC7_25720 [Weizmannia acidilactici]|uniref:Sulfurtransferase n=1 Tax=Weizmannia acidilactici TaxID=2607726 RepID=A0A5J4JJ66_9BACI|nr:sulfurtransferase [Weizmannia acidilactici]GER67542.1 hypothetical protein BpJC4_20130 [Weizmannia acidilactici]GER71269.1 hypothetical protein BpJC7_25720 [Weizmannia acidilactici]GER74703.1 hypothetical protein BpPP18_27700 [Weizmannia acidilactici]
MYVVFFILALILIKIGYTRYFPVHGITRTELRIDDMENKVVVDVRDYQDAGSGSVQGAITIPTAYLKRFSCQIPKGNLHIISSNQLEANFGIRFLRRKGFHISSYSVIHS